MADDRCFQGPIRDLKLHTDSDTHTHTHKAEHAALREALN